MSNPPAPTGFSFGGFDRATQNQAAQNLNTHAPSTQMPDVQNPGAQNQDTQSSKDQDRHDGLHKLLNTGEYSDFTVICGKRTWHVHRAIVCSRSTYFKKACGGNFKEAQQRKITFEEDEAPYIEQVLLYLYTMQYPQSSPTTNRTGQDLIFDASMYAVADKYELVDLKLKVKKAFERLLFDNFDDALFTEVAALVYESTLQKDRGLRDPLLDVLWDKKSILLLKPEVQECIMAHEGFKDDVLESLFLDPGSVEPQIVNTAPRFSVGAGSKKRNGGGRYAPRKAR